MKYDWSKLPTEKIDMLLELCPRDTYRVVAPDQISGLLSDSLVKKFDSVLLVSSGVYGSDAVVFMANGHRVDAKDSAIDQMPFGFGYRNGGANSERSPHSARFMARANQHATSSFLDSCSGKWDWNLLSFVGTSEP